MKNSPLASLIQGDGLKIVIPKDLDNDPEVLLEVFNTFMGTSLSFIEHVLDVHRQVV